MNLIWQLRDDVDRQAALRDAAERGAGVLVHGIVPCSEEFWRALDAGRIPLGAIDGTVSRISGLESHGFPVVHIVEPSGRSTEVELFGPPQAYPRGARVRYQFVEGVSRDLPDLGPLRIFVAAISSVEEDRR